MRPSAVSGGSDPFYDFLQSRADSKFNSQNQEQLETLSPLPACHLPRTVSTAQLPPGKGAATALGLENQTEDTESVLPLPGFSMFANEWNLSMCGGVRAMSPPVYSRLWRERSRGPAAKRCLTSPLNPHSASTKQFLPVLFFEMGAYYIA